MPIVFETFRARLATSAAALLGLAGCAGSSDPEPQAVEPIATQPVVEQPVVTTAAIGEEDDGYAVTPPDGTATTLALGEEDGGYAAPPTDNFATTLAVGEEDGSGPIPVEPDGGIGDGAGPIPFEPGQAPTGNTTGQYERIYIPEDPDNIGQPVNDGLVTTLAIGEEG